MTDETPPIMDIESGGKSHFQYARIDLDPDHVWVITVHRNGTVGLLDNAPEGPVYRTMKVTELETFAQSLLNIVDWLRAPEI